MLRFPRNAKAGQPQYLAKPLPERYLREMDRQQILARLRENEAALRAASVKRGFARLARGHRSGACRPEQVTVNHRAGNQQLQETRVVTRWPSKNITKAKSQQNN